MDSRKHNISSTLQSVPRNAVEQLLTSQTRVNKQGLKTIKGIAICNVAPEEVYSYDKATETDPVEANEGYDSFDEFSEDHSVRGRRGRRVKATFDAPGAAARTRSVMGDTKGRLGSVMGDKTRGKSGSVIGDMKNRRVRFASPQAGLESFAEIPLRQFNGEELEEIINTSDFKDFLESTSLMVERLLSMNERAAFRDYTQLRKESVVEDHELLLKPIKYIDKNVAGRPVNDIQPSPIFPELFVAAYGSVKSIGRYSAAHEASAGFVCVWSTALATRPEFRFTASSPVQTAQFHSFNQHLIVGGCYTGQMLLWDMRAKTLPVQRSAMGSLKGHKHPIVSISMAGAQNSHEMVSVSVDGTICSWDLSRLSEPLTTTLIPLPNVSSDAFNFTSNPLDSLRASSAAYGFEGKKDAFRSLIIGSEIGKLYGIDLPFRLNDPIKPVLFKFQKILSKLVFVDFCSSGPHHLSPSASFIHHKLQEPALDFFARLVGQVMES